ncbi:ArsR/SmtB family transcription factor [Microvirga flavescens]|uniref:ArsR/SmtB family transcription factor n=1 Tax=Microvirga flavescens TaxID=2249811 RepID=UPI000DD719C4|nr:winged helix-turn-helix domain-containing protein [Microvirga flavescens]
MTTLVSGIVLAEIAASIGDVSRANILSALMDGRALTASELAWHANVSAQTASGHLAKLVETSLLAVEKQGRHRYYRLASPEVAHAIEALMAVASAGPKRYRPVGPKDTALRNARTCYDHLAGRLGIAVTDALTSRNYVVLSDSAGAVTEAGHRFLCDMGIDLAEPGHKRALCRTCLDWSERRPHLAGRLGAALCTHMFERGWIERIKDTRALKVTALGKNELKEFFGIEEQIDAGLR